MSKLVFVNSVLTITLHDGNHLEFPVPIPQFFQGPKAMSPALPTGNFEVPLASEEGKEQQILKGTAAEIVIALTKGYNPTCLTKEGKLDGKAYSEQLAKLQGILAGKATKDEAETAIVLNNAALISTIERALNPELDEKISAIEDASEDANPYTIAIEAITEALLTDDVASPEAAPEEVKEAVENAPESVVETPATAEAPITADLPAIAPVDSLPSMGLAELKAQLGNLVTANNATIATSGKLIAAQKAINEAMEGNNVALTAQQELVASFQRQLEAVLPTAIPETASK